MDKKAGRLQAELDKFFVSRVKRRRADKTLAFYRTGLTQWAIFTDYEWPPTGDGIEDFLNSCRDRELTDGSIDAYYRAIKIFCNWLARRRVLTDNPISQVEPPDKPERNQPRAPTQKTVELFFGKINSQVEQILDRKTHLVYWQYIRNLAIYSLLYKTGLRVSEVSRLKLADLDMEARIVKVVSTRQKPTKNRKPREVPFDQRAATDLRLWLSIRQQLGVPAGLESAFVSAAYGFWETYTPGGIRQSLKDYCREWEIEPFTPHQFRHAFAVNYLASGGSLNGAQRLLGHADPQTTAIYTQMPNEDAIEEYRAILERKREEAHRNGKPPGDRAAGDSGS